MEMSKRKRERLDIGSNDQKKPKSSRTDERAATLHRKHEGPVGKELEDKDAAGVETKSIKGTHKAKNTKNQEDSDGHKAVIERAPLRNDTSQTVAASHEKLELRVAKLERRKGKKMKSGDHSNNAQVVSKHRKGSQQKGRLRSRNEKSFWKVSDAIGGQMLDLDPIFALNEE